MGRISDREKLDELVQRFGARGIASQIYVLDQGAEIRLEPTDQLIAHAIDIAALGYLLHYDGKNVRVIERPQGGLPTQETNEAEAEKQEPTWQAEFDPAKITEDAAAFAQSVGLLPTDVVKQVQATGEDGKVTTTDVADYVKERIVT